MRHVGCMHGGRLCGVRVYACMCVQYWYFAIVSEVSTLTVSAIIPSTVMLFVLSITCLTLTRFLFPSSFDHSTKILFLTFAISSISFSYGVLEFLSTYAKCAHTEQWINIVIIFNDIIQCTLNVYSWTLMGAFIWSAFSWWSSFTQHSACMHKWVQVIHAQILFLGLFLYRYRSSYRYLRFILLAILLLLTFSMFYSVIQVFRMANWSSVKHSPQLVCVWST